MSWEYNREQERLGPCLQSSWILYIAEQFIHHTVSSEGWNLGHGLCFLASDWTYLDERTLLSLNKGVLYLPSQELTVLFVHRGHFNSDVYEGSGGDCPEHRVTGPWLSHWCLHSLLVWAEASSWPTTRPQWEERDVEKRVCVWSWDQGKGSRTKWVDSSPAVQCCGAH